MWGSRGGAQLREPDGCLRNEKGILSGKTETHLATDNGGSSFNLRRKRLYGCLRAGRIIEGLSLSHVRRDGLHGNHSFFIVSKLVCVRVCVCVCVRVLLITSHPPHR